MQLAGMIGRYFGIDPVTVLESDYENWAIRIAAYQHARRIEEQSAKKKK